MSASNHKGGSRAPGLLIGGLVAGALGLALSAGNYGSAASSASDRGSAVGGSASDTGMSSQTGGMSNRSSAGTGNPSSSGRYGTGMEGAASLPPNVTPGWKIRVCSEKTKADQITFRFASASADKGSKGSAGTGATGGSGSAGMGGSGSGSAGAGHSASPSNTAGNTAVNAALSDQSVSWTRGEATEIKAPGEMRDADRIRLEATPSQKDRKSSVCVIYNDHVAKKLNFDDREVSMIKSTDNAECGC
jgi:hypothetical protein